MVKAGYKQTEAGVIPEDWEVKAMDEVGVPLIGLTYKPSDVQASGTLVLRSSNVQEGRLAFDDNVFVEMDIPARATTKKDDILICVRNGSRQLIGKCALIDRKTAGSAFGAFMSVFRSDINQFVFFQFQSDALKKQINEVLGATINQITSRDLKTFQLPLPPTLAEQQAIAEALSDVDGLIGSLEQLIAKKRAIKTGTMQQLLTGKQRLPGFSGEWETKQLGDLVTPSNERIDPRKAGSGTFCVELEHMGSATGTLVGSTTTSEQSSHKSVFRGGDVLFGKLRAYLCKYWRADRSGVCSTEIWVFSPAEHILSSEYLFHAVQKSDFIEVASASFGTHMPRSDWSVVKNYELPLPPTIAEQQAIATVLSDMDAEIQTLETKLAKTKAIKQGMMQELLTGKTRLRQGPGGQARLA